MNLSKDQIDAKTTILDWLKSRTSSRATHMTLGGYAGTGKSLLIAEVRKSLPVSWKVAFCAYTGKATGVMKDRLLDVDAYSINDFIGTIHSLCYTVREDPETGMNVFHRRPHIDYDLIVVDEASMVNKELYSDLKYYGIPILFVGDHGQLPPISSDGFNLMDNPMIRLENVHRFGNQSALLDLSVMARMGEDIPFKRFDQNVVKTHENDPIVNDFINNDLRDFSDGVCLCATNNTRVDVNQLIRQNLGIINGIDDKYPRVNDRVVCLQNNRSLAEPIYNGMLGRIRSIGAIDRLSVETYSMSISMDDGFVYNGLVSKTPFGRMKHSGDSREFVTFKELMNLKSKLTIAERKKIRKIGRRKLYFDCFDFGYCLTVHKAQGSEWGNVLLFDEECGYMSEDDRRRWMYTAVTRSSEKLVIIG